MHVARFFLVASAISVMLTGCGKKDESKDAAPSTPVVSAVSTTTEQELIVKIGHVGPLTGGIAHLGKDNENGARLAIEQANAKGFEIGGKNVKFALLTEDDQADPKIGATVAQKLVDAQVVGIVGHLNSGTTEPASDIYNHAGIPNISGSSTKVGLSERGFQTFFRVVGRDDQQGPAIANYLIGSSKPKIVAILDDATAYGEGIANEVEKTLKANGVTVLPREKGTDKTVDWKSQLTKIKGKKPDAVFFGGMDATAGPLIKQARELGMDALFSFGDGACTNEMSRLAGEAAEGLICSQAGIPVQAASKGFSDAYKARFNTDPILYSPFTYDAANLLISAMKNAESIDPAKYLAELKKIQFTGASGDISFDEKGDRKDAEMTIFTMTSGKIDPIAIIKAGKSLTLAEYQGIVKE